MIHLPSHSSSAQPSLSPSVMKWQEALRGAWLSELWVYHADVFFLLLLLLQMNTNKHSDLNTVYCIKSTNKVSCLIVILNHLLLQTCAALFWLWKRWKWRNPSCYNPDWSFVLISYHVFVVLADCLSARLSVCLSVADRALYLHSSNTSIFIMESGHSTWRCVRVPACV